MNSGEVKDEFCRRYKTDSPKSIFDSGAKEIGVSFATVNRWETGKAKPNLKTMKLIDEYCKKNAIDFDISEEIN